MGEGKDFETALAENAAGSFVGGAIGELGGRIAKAFFKNIGTLPLPNHIDGPSGTVNVPSGNVDVLPGGLDPYSGADIPGSGTTPNGQDPTLTGEGNTHPGDSGDGMDDGGRKNPDDENGPGGPNICRSFSADTEVATEEGLTPISELEVGDKVLAYNQNTGETGEHEITAIGEHTDSVTFLTIDGEVIETTHDHPFYTLERGWTSVENLQPGDHILQADGTYGVVEAVSATILNQPMFNLTVDTAHTFFVGEGQWLVHNDICDIDWKLENEDYFIKEYGRTADEQAGGNVAVAVFYPNTKQFKQLALYDEAGQVVYRIDAPHGNIKHYHYHKMEIPGQASSGHLVGDSHPKIGKNGTFEDVKAFLRDELNFGNIDWWTPPK